MPGIRRQSQRSQKPLRVRVTQSGLLTTLGNKTLMGLQKSAPNEVNIAVLWVRNSHQSADLAQRVINRRRDLGSPLIVADVDMPVASRVVLDPIPRLFRRKLLVAPRAFENERNRRHHVRPVPLANGAFGGVP